MNRLIAVHAPATVIGDDLLILSVELWTGGVVVHFARVGTRFRRNSGHAGGTGAEWRGTWNFVPGAPEQATRLTLAVGDDALELEL